MGCEVVDNGILHLVPIRAKDPVVVREDISRDFGNVANDISARLISLIKVDSKHLLAVLLQGGDLRHVGVIDDVESLWDEVGVRALGQGSRVRVTDQRCLEVEAPILVQSPREARDVLSGVALSGHVKVLTLQVRERLPDADHKGHKLI